jgi:hypothetical protein
MVTITYLGKCLLYINKFCYFDNDIIIRITDITIIYGSFAIVGAGLIKNDICQQISIVPKYEKITKLNFLF